MNKDVGSIQVFGSGDPCDMDALLEISCQSYPFYILEGIVRHSNLVKEILDVPSNTRLNKRITFNLFFRVAVSLWTERVK